MREEEAQRTETTEAEFRKTNHPWVDLSAEDDTIGEAVRYSLDEIRYA